MDVSALNVSYGDTEIYNNFSIHFPDNKISVILGPSGCGKTTLLNSIAHIFGKKPNTISYMYQEPRLLPWCTIEKNIMLVLRGSEKEKRIRAQYYLDKLGLKINAGKYPNQLSGGECQRVSLARAFAYPASILILDEPFKSIDPRLKIQIYDFVKTIRQEEKKTIILVTHDIEEAVTLADIVIVLNGRPVTVLKQLAAGSSLKTQLEFLQYSEILVNGNDFE